MADPAELSPKQREREAMRARMLDETHKLLREGGLEAVKARAIADRVGVAVGSVYYMFGDLETLVREVNGGIYDELMEAGRGALDALGDRAGSEKRLLALARAYLEFVRTHAISWGGLLAFNQRHLATTPEWYLKKQNALLDLIGSSLADLPGASDPATRARAARALWASVHGIVSTNLGRLGDKHAFESVWAQIELIAGSVAEKLADN